MSTTANDLTETERAYLAAAEAGDLDRAATLLEQVDADQAATERRLNGPGALRATTLWYATTLGLPVFPCLPGQKRPATAHGFQDATTDTQQIDAWWRVNPRYNVAAPTGITFDVIDVDGPAGLRKLDPFFPDTQILPDRVALALTPRGRHYYMRPTGRGNASRWNGLTDVDYRGAGGYVLLPPSRTDQGTYRWHEPLRSR